MPIDVDLQPLFNATVTICKRTSTHSNGYTKPGYQSTSAGTSYDAHIEQSEMLFRTDQGHITRSVRKIFLYSTTAWSQSSNIPRVTDKIILPDSFSPKEPPIFSVSPVSDENGIHHVLVFTG